MKINKQKLIEWIKSVHELGMSDEPISIAYFRDTMDEQFIIIAGWSDGYDEDTSDGYLHSASEPTWCMNIKIAINEEYNSNITVLCPEFDMMNMPWFADTGDVYDSDVLLHVEENFEEIADWLIKDYEAINEAFAKGELKIQ